MVELVAEVAGSVADGYAGANRRHQGVAQAGAALLDVARVLVSILAVLEALVTNMTIKSNLN